jgi:hypothetical protein
VEVAQLRAKLTALDDFAGDQFEASLCTTPSCKTAGHPAHGEESSVAGLLPFPVYCWFNGGIEKMCILVDFMMPLRRDVIAVCVRQLSPQLFRF